VIPNAGTVDKGVGGVILEQEFPPTPMEDWEVYPVEDTRREVIPGGLMEHRILVEAIPPIDDREVIS
jgi:hypothetical protein